MNSAVATIPGRISSRQLSSRPVVPTKNNAQTPPAALLRDLQSLVVDDLVLHVSLSNSRKTIEIIVERDASLTLKAPPTVTVERAQQFVKAKSEWVYRKLVDKDALTGPPVVKQFVEGEGFVYLGRNYRLTLTSGTGNTGSTGGVHATDTGTGDTGIDAAGTGTGSRGTDAAGVRLRAGRFHLSAAQTNQGAILMRRWYTEVGGQWLRRRIQPWAARLGEEAVEVKVRDLGYRWGSARPVSSGQHINGRQLGEDNIQASPELPTTSRRCVNIHWATLQLPPSLIDYVLVHELAHLREANHTPDYWKTVARLMPDYETHKTSLASIGQNIWLGAVSEV